jgi:hypothetical protein
MTDYKGSDLTAFSAEPEGVEGFAGWSGTTDYRFTFGTHVPYLVDGVLPATFLPTDMSVLSEDQLDSLAQALLQRMAFNTSASTGASLHFRVPDDDDDKAYGAEEPLPLGWATKEELWSDDVHEAKAISSLVWAESRAPQTFDFTSSWTPNLNLFFDAEMTVTGDMTINLPENMRARRSGYITLILSGSYTIQFASADLANFVGGENIVFPTTDGSRITLWYKCINTTSVEIERRFASAAALGGMATGPTLTTPIDLANETTAATGSVYTNQLDGTLYWVVLLTADTTPSAANVKLGKKANGSTDAEDSGNQAVTVGGTQALSPAPSGLTAATGYKIAFMHENGDGLQSTVVVGDGFTTAAASGASVTYLVRLGANEYNSSVNLGTYAAGRRIWVAMSQTNAFGTVALGSSGTLTPVLSTTAGGRNINVYMSDITTSGTVTIARSAYPAYGMCHVWATFGAAGTISDSAAGGTAASGTSFSDLSLDIPANGVVMVHAHRMENISAPAVLNTNQHADDNFAVASEAAYASTVAPETVSLTLDTAGTYRAAVVFSVAAE